MRKRYLLFALAVAAGAAVFGALASHEYQGTRYTVRIRPAQVETDIRKRLPIGSSRAAVEAYLDEGGIPHSYIGEDNYSKDRNCELAIIRDTAHNWLIRTDIQIYFNYDKKLKLASYSVQEINTGP